MILIIHKYKKAYETKRNEKNMNNELETRKKTLEHNLTKLLEFVKCKTEPLEAIKIYENLITIVKAELEKIEQQSRKKYDALENTGIITSDRFERFQILDFLWKAKRSATERNSGIEDSVHISNSLNIEEVKVRTHLEVLEDHRLISISNRTRGGWIVEITGKGTTHVENFFIQLEQYFRNSDNLEIKKHIQKTDQEHDVVMKHTLHMQIAMTVQEVFKFGNNLLSKL